MIQVSTIDQARQYRGEGLLLDGIDMVVVAARAMIGSR